MFIAFQTTPNPDALKFLPPARLTLGETVTVERGDRVAPPLASALLSIPSVLRVMLGPDFVTVTRRPDEDPWPALKPQILSLLAAHLIAHPGPWSGDGPEAPAMDEVEAEIRQVIALYVRPGALRDGGDILVEGFDAATGVLTVRMEGACNGCPSSQLTLRAGVEQIVRRYVPEVTRVEHLAATSGPARPPSWRRWLEKAAPAGARARTVFSHNGVAREPKA